ncbi:hypothetical protein FHW12_003341 [Dokdonella fugitiva]|uniref:Uncharacterized protein n=1 Tax=Dokdonella fugitiva TaxID=328517 RepID=A0A839F6D1_9GAMM|nr:hypothetical protein [Dokdonella fugitiva]MBA8889098.1 hypothetical protein [Dokdonella fugitiva]
MADTTAFDAKTLTYIACVASVYASLTWLPVIWPLVVTHRERKPFPRRWLFVATVASLSYGVVSAFLVLLTIPLTAYSSYIAPQLAIDGFRGTDWLVEANGYVVDYWWLALPIALALLALAVTRKLKPAWAVICSAMTANNSCMVSPCT